MTYGGVRFQCQRGSILLDKQHQCLNVGDEEDLDHDKLVMEALLILQERLENKSIK